MNRETSILHLNLHVYVYCIWYIVGYSLVLEKNSLFVSIKIYKKTFFSFISICLTLFAVRFGIECSSMQREAPKFFTKE